MAEKTESIKSIAIAIAIVIIVGMFMYIMSQRNGAGSFTIKSGNSELAIDFSGQQLNLDELIKQLEPISKLKTCCDWL